MPASPESSLAASGAHTSRNSPTALLLVDLSIGNLSSTYSVHEDPSDVLGVVPPPIRTPPPANPAGAETYYEQKADAIRRRAASPTSSLLSSSSPLNCPSPGPLPGPSEEPPPEPAAEAEPDSNNEPLSTPIKFHDYVVNASASASRRQVVSPSQFHFSGADVQFVGRQRQHRTHVGKRPMSAPNAKRNAALRQRPMSAKVVPGAARPAPTPGSAGRKVQRPMTAPMNREKYIDFLHEQTPHRHRPQSSSRSRTSSGENDAQLTSARTPYKKTALFPDPPPKARPQSSPIYQTTTHPMQKTMEHRRHEENAHHANDAWRKPKVRTVTGVKERVKSADRLRRAREFDQSLNVIDETIRFINESPPTVPNEDTEHARNDQVALLLRKALIHLQQQSWMHAKEACDEALKIGTGVPSAKCYAYRGAAYLGMKMLDAAASECQIALNLAPELVAARFWLAASKFRAEDFRAAIKECSKVLSANPGHVESWSMRCESKRRLGMWTSLAADCDAFVKSAGIPKEKRAQGWTAKAEAMLHMKKFREAELSATNALNANPEIMMAYQIRGEARYQLKMYKKSVSDFHEFGKLDRQKRGVAFVSPCYATWHSNRDRPW